MELVATEPRDGVSRPYRADQPFGHPYQQFVPSCVTHGVVDTLEIVQVEEQDRDLPSVTGVQLEGVLQAISEQASVGQTRHAVVEGFLVQLRLADLQSLGQGHIPPDVEELAQQ